MTYGKAPKSSLPLPTYVKKRRSVNVANLFLSLALNLTSYNDDFSENHSLQLSLLLLITKLDQQITCFGFGTVSYIRFFNTSEPSDNYEHHSRSNQESWILPTECIMGFVPFLEHPVTTSLNSVERPFFVMEKCAFFEVRIERLNLTIRNLNCVCMYVLAYIGERINDLKETWHVFFLQNRLTHKNCSISG
jgi:hypothetical protein